MKKISLKNPDGSFNGKLIAGLISLLIVLVQQVLAVFGIKFAGDWTSIVAVVNTVLTILGILGVNCRRTDCKRLRGRDRHLRTSHKRGRLN